MKWVLRIVLLLLAVFVASKSYEDSRQVLDSIEMSGKDGQIHVTNCRPFDCALVLQFYDGIEGQYPALAGSGSGLRDVVEHYQGLTFMWGFASALMLGGIIFSFFRFSRPREEEPTRRPGNPLSIS